MIDRLEDVLQTSVVLVGLRLLSGAEKENFKRIVGTDVIAEEAPSVILGLPSAPIDLTPQKLTLPKERITFDLQAASTAITREYPSHDDLERFANVIKLALERSDTTRQNLQAYGFNIEVVYSLEDDKTALEYFSTQVFRESLFEDTEFRIAGGAPQLTLLRGGEIWNVGLEPRLQDPASGKLFARWNLHRQDTKPPSPHTILTSLTKIWEQAHEFAGGHDL